MGDRRFGPFVCLLLTVTVVAGCATNPKPTPQSAQPPRLTDQELVVLLENASTSADHARLVAYYDQEAAELEAKAAKNSRTAAAYRQRAPSPKFPTSPWAADHYEMIAQSAQKAALEARTMAEYHRMLAKLPS